jgi:peroxiredoxin
VIQVVDLQEDKDFQGLNLQLLSISPDAVEDWREAGKGMGIEDFDGVLSDAENKVATKYEVMQCAVGGRAGSHVRPCGRIGSGRVATGLRRDGER